MIYTIPNMIIPHLHHQYHDYSLPRKKQPIFFFRTLKVKQMSLHSVKLHHRILHKLQLCLFHPHFLMDVLVRKFCHCSIGRNLTPVLVQSIAAVTSFKYLGSVVTNEGSKPKILSRIAQTTTALTQLKLVWNDRSISLSSKIQLMCSLFTSVFLYACESWTLTAEL